MSNIIQIIRPKKKKHNFHRQIWRTPPGRRGGTEADRLLRIFLRETIRESLTLLSRSLAYDELADRPLKTMFPVKPPPRPVATPSRRLTSRVPAHGDVWVYWQCREQEDVSRVRVRDMSMGGLFHRDTP